MSSDIAIRVEGLSKKYLLQHKSKGDGLRHALQDVISGSLRKVRSAWGNGHNGVSSSAVSSHPLPAEQKTEEFWALKDVSFEIKRGEVVGIIGRNGAGKSTLLKLLSRITEPTTGRIEIDGRVASLLEVGTGFHPELTGRENVFLNGAILGMSRSEVRSRFDAIVDFAEVEKFLDTPVKRYSSGMYVRLAFAVAAHLEPEILIVDEVLAVGDAKFQQKCLSKLDSVAGAGRTVLLVSHQMSALARFASSALLLESGSLKSTGDLRRALDLYTGDLYSGGRFWCKPHPTEPRVIGLEVETSHSGYIHDHSAPVRFVFEIDVPVTVKGARLSCQVRDEMMQPAFVVWRHDSERPFLRGAGVHRITCEIPKCRLYKGRYSLTIYLQEYKGGRCFQVVENICPFEVQMLTRHLTEGDWVDGAARYLEDFAWSE